MFDGYVFKDLMDLSASTLATMVKDYIKPSKEKTEEGSEDETATDSDSKEEEKTEEGSEETAVLTYQGKDYTVNKAVFEKWLAENATLAK